LLDRILKRNLEHYLSAVYQSRISVLSIDEIGRKSAGELKGFGYGKPYRITFEREGIQQAIVLETMSENSFGHDHFSDRAQVLLWNHSAANHLPFHVRSIDVGAFTADKEMISAGKADEFFQVTEYVPGKEYASDLYRIYNTGQITDLDLQRVNALADYLAAIHAVKDDAPSLYTRRIRDLIGHGECIMGLIDNYPVTDPIATPERLKLIEQACVDWRWKVRNRTHRLSQVHGDFHPWNVLFREGTDFTVLDRSRGEWGEPADDLSSMMMNFLFLSLQKNRRLDAPFATLYSAFWRKYQISAQDAEMMQVIQPFFAWRGLVVANPIWYPQIAPEVRAKLFDFIERVLTQDRFDPETVNELL
jgi:Ser/Thr protein kinase RdoA (MazF antagonist)